MIGYNKSEIVGKMRERVILQNRIITQSDSGFQSEIYNDIGIYWSKIEYKTGFEEEDADKITNQQKINITLRYNILVNVNSRFVYRNELYQVEKVEYSDDRRFMTCVCVWRSSYTSIYAGSIFCSASLLAQSSLSAALMRVIKYQASLNAFGSVSADIALVKKVASSLNAFGTLTGDITFVKNMQAALNGTAALSGGINFVQKPDASLNAFGTLVSDLKIAKTFESSLNANGTLISNATIAKNLESSLTSSNSLAANALVSKLASASLTGTGTTAANLTVQSASFDADAQAFFNRVTTAGGTLTTTEQNAVNTLVIQMKADGIWTKMKAIYPMVGGAGANPAAACAQNLKSASFTGTFTTGWTFAATGVTPNGTSAFMNTGLVPSVHIASQNSNHISFYSRSSLAASTQVEMGSLSGSLYFHTHLRHTGDIYFMLLAASTLGNVSNNNSLGFFNGSRINSTNVIHLRNGVILGNPAITSVALNSVAISIGALNSNGTITNFSSKQCAFASIGDGLTDTEAANFYTAVQAFQTTLNRQV